MSFRLISPHPVLSLLLFIGKPIYLEFLEWVNPTRGDINVSWKDLIPLLIVVLGIIMFLYGANYYDVAIGWVGIGFALGGLVAEIVLKVYEFVRQKREVA